MPIHFVGDLSIQDAKGLRDLGKNASRILEFGSGGSTQIFAQCCPNELVSVETEHDWIKRTEENLSRIPHAQWTRPTFVPYDFFKYKSQFDLIFIDGIPNKRLDFAMRAWPLLASGGRIVFHDTRHFHYFREAAWLIQSFFGEIRNVSINSGSSNLTVIEKGNLLTYENWNYTEGKPLWSYGAEPVPSGAALWVLED